MRPLAHSSQRRINWVLKTSKAGNNLSGQSAPMFDCPFREGAFPWTCLPVHSQSSLCPAVQSPVLFPWWLPIGMGAAGKFPQSHPISRLTKPSSLSPSAQGECSSPSHVGDLLWAAASLLVLFFYQRPKTGPSPSAAVYLPALFHTRENNSSCLLPLRNWRLRKFLKSTSFKRLCSTWQSLKWVTVAAYNPHHSLLELKSTCSGFFCSLCLLL